VTTDIHNVEPIDRSSKEQRELVQRLKAGDEEAFEEIVRTLGGRLLSVARRFLVDEDAARDAVQDALLSAFRGIQAFDEQAQLSTWLHRIVVNAALMRIRTRARRPECSIDSLLPRFLEDGHYVEVFAAPDERIDRTLEREETRAMVRAAIAELPESYRAVLLLRDIEEMSTKDSAEALGISENAAKLRLHRARQALATLIRRNGFQPISAPQACAGQLM
jgi:RNA polymerase sigma-70 factor, ECF subfamily